MEVVGFSGDNIDLFRYEIKYTNTNIEYFCLDFQNRSVADMADRWGTGIEQRTKKAFEGNNIEYRYHFIIVEIIWSWNMTYVSSSLWQREWYWYNLSSHDLSLYTEPNKKMSMTSNNFIHECRKSLRCCYWCIPRVAVDVAKKKCWRPYVTVLCRKSSDVSCYM